MPTDNTILPPCPILYEDNHLLVVSKPAPLATMGAPQGVDTLQRLCQHYLKQKYDKPGNVFLGIVSRLDAPVTGAVVMARTSKAARRLTEQFRAGSVEKTYWAIVQPPPCTQPGANESPSDVTELTHWIQTTTGHRKVRLTTEDEPGAQLARLLYRVVAQDGRQALLEVRPLTGRKHQIRVQLSAIGCTILGDRKYGEQAKFSVGMALHSRRVKLIHPVTKAELGFTAPIPPAWNSYDNLLRN